MACAYDSSGDILVLPMESPASTDQGQQSILSESLQARVADCVADVLESGTPPDSGLPRIRELARQEAANIVQDLPSHVDELRELRDAFEERLGSHWGRAFDLFALHVARVREQAEYADSVVRPTLEEDHAIRWHALSRLMPLACRVADEILALARAGFPEGASARGRTLHEISVVGFTLYEAPSDISKRFLEHEIVGRSKDAEAYIASQDRLRLKPLAPEEVDDLIVQRNALVEQYGASFVRDYGWAAPLFERGAPTFRDLEKRCNLDHLRPYYRMTSNDVHAGARAATQILIEHQGQPVFRAGATNTGFAEPVHGAAISLNQVATSFHLESMKTRPEDLVFSVAELSFLRLHQELVEELGALLGQAQSEIDVSGLDP